MDSRLEREKLEPEGSLRSAGPLEENSVSRAAGIVWKMRERVNSDAWDGYLREIWL